MIKTKSTKLDFNDILIEPTKKTKIKSRYNEIDNQYAYVNDKHVINHYPIFTAPMDSVVDQNNMLKFTRLGIPVVLPRTFTYKNYISYITDKEGFENNQLFPDFCFVSFSLKDFEKIYSELYAMNNYPVPQCVLIDTANGHLNTILMAVIKAKALFPDTLIMVGNIANPKTYKWYAESGAVDFIRIGIGNGNGCLTTEQLGVGYPMASLIADCYKEKKKLEHKKILCPKIVADGGMKSYSDIYKSLALGADYVMAGSIFNLSLESAGDNYLYGVKLPLNIATKFYEWNLPIKKKFYGMSTKIAQKKMGNENIKTSEGVVRYREVEYTLEQWKDNFDHYLRSAMSYVNAKTLKEFVGAPNIILISDNAYKRFNK